MKKHDAYVNDKTMLAYQKYLKGEYFQKARAIILKDGEVAWICLNCGHIHFGKEAPAACPVCAHPQAYFMEKAENY